jgi:CRISPR-associated endonuclease/helicase Cas3
MYIARFNNNLKTQSVRDHTLNVANLCKIFGDKLNVSNFSYLSGLLHDMGKYSRQFKDYIDLELIKAKNGNNEMISDVADKVDHGVYGAKYIYEKYNNRDEISCVTSEMLALICCYHHGGLPDCLNNKYEVPLLERLKKINPNDLMEVYKIYNDDINIDIDQIFDNACSEIKTIFGRLKIFDEEAFFAMHLLIKTTYSMLIDADRYDSYLFEAGKDTNKQIISILNMDNKMVWHEYSVLLEKRLEKFKNQPSLNENERRINKIRQEISVECLQFADNKEGIYTLTVPTGGGKTLSSLRFALKHIELKDKDRIIYILPFTTIIEQNAEEVRKALECNDDLLEYHSNVMEDDKGENYKLLTNRWSNKIIYTTMVQFLNTFYNKGTQDMRRIHNLLNSVIIFDEIQTIPIKCIDLFVGCINYLTEIGNSTVVLCSATQPELNKSNVPVLYSKKREIIKNVDNKFNILERVEVVDFTRKGGYTSEEAASFIQEVKKNVINLLMVCNTVGWASSIYDILNKDENKDTYVYFLSSNLCPAHRKDLIEDLKADLKNKKNIICISTQLIEAGVDISFETTVRALAGLDSIAQTSGRANRNGEKIKGYSYIINLNDDDKLSRLTEIRLGKTHCAEFLYEYGENKNMFGNSLLSPRSIEEYFNIYYSDKMINNGMDYPVKNTSIYRMLEYSESNIDGYEGDFPLNLRYKFKTASEMFKVIDNNTKTILVPYKEGKNLISKLVSNSSYDNKKKTLDNLGQYSVNIYDNMFEALKKAGGIVADERYGIYILKDFYYDKIQGVTLKKKMNFLGY